MASFSGCREFFRVFNHVDKWLKSDGNETGYLFIPRCIQIDPLNGLETSTNNFHSTDTLLTTDTETLSSCQQIQLQNSSTYHNQENDIDPEYLDAVLINRKHVQDREMRKKHVRIVQNIDNIQYVEISEKETLNLNAKRKSTTEQNIIKRRKMYKDVKSNGLKNIRILENELQTQFDIYMKTNLPKLWPCIPVRLMFED